MNFYLPVVRRVISPDDPRNMLLPLRNRRDYMSVGRPTVFFVESLPPLTEEQKLQWERRRFLQTITRERVAPVRSGGQDGSEEGSTP